MKKNGGYTEMNIKNGIFFGYVIWIFVTVLVALANAQEAPKPEKPERPKLCVQPNDLHVVYTFDKFPTAEQQNMATIPSSPGPVLRQSGPPVFDLSTGKWKLVMIQPGPFIVECRPVKAEAAKQEEPKKEPK